MIQTKTAFITGITGQDGGYLAAFLLAKGYEVHGLVRWDCVDGTQRLKALGLEDRVQLYYGDICDAANVISLIKQIRPDEIYNLAALTHVHVSFETPSSTMDVNVKGTLNILDGVQILGLKDTKIYQASSSEMFGRSKAPQNEQTPFEPCSPYGAAKLAAYWLARIYRDSHGMFVCNGILFNHESPLRGEDFVTRKIVKAVAAIEAGAQTRLLLGNLDSRRDWGHARDYVEGMWLMMQQDMPGDFVLATGETHTVREFVTRAFAQTGITMLWQGNGAEEVGYDEKTGRVYVRVDPSLFRPKDIHYLQGDAEKARKILGWQPRVFFDALVSEMVNAERQKYWQEGAWKKTG
jgi:GDPmannose 4,6-dehydratase